MQGIQTAEQDIEEIFECFDQNGDQLISFDEFASYMLELDHTRTADSLRANFEKIDTNHDGWVSCDEFRAWCN